MTDSTRWEHQRPVMSVLEPAEFCFSGRKNRTNRPKTANATLAGQVGRSRDLLSPQLRAQSAKTRSPEVPGPSSRPHRDVYTPLRLIEKLVCRLPEELQMNIVEVAGIMSTSEKRLRTLSDRQNIELQQMSVAHEKKNAELHSSLHTCEMYRARLADLENVCNNMRDEIDRRDSRSEKKRLSDFRLNASNLAHLDMINGVQHDDMTPSPQREQREQRGYSNRDRDSSIHENRGFSSHVVDSLDDSEGVRWYSPGIHNGDRIQGPHSGDRIQGPHSRDRSPYNNGDRIQGPSYNRDRIKSTSADNSSAVPINNNISEKILSSPTILVGRLRPSTPCKENKPFCTSSRVDLNENDGGLTNSKGESLRNTVLKMTREKYRNNKKIEILGNEVEALKSKLQLSELKCRHLQINLAEFIGNDNGNDFSFSLKTAHSLTTRKDFGPQDEVFRMMIEKRAIDPVESILQFKRMVEWMAQVPLDSLIISNVAAHITSQQMTHIFDVDMICIYIIDPNNKKLMHKYSIRSEKSELFDISESESIVTEVLHTGTPIKYSNIKQSNFNIKVDGCPGIFAQNILSVPIKNQKNNEILGAINLLNKLDGKVAFTELDEIIASVFSLMAVSAILGCQKFQHVSFRSDVLTSVLASPLGLLSLMPDRASLFGKDVHGGEVLNVIEMTCQTALKCLKVKAFILSDCMCDMEVGVLLSRREKGQHSPPLRRGAIPLLNHNPAELGIAGYVARTKKWSVQLDGDTDFHFNPLVDLDAQGMPCVTVPIMSVEGDVLVCVQMVLGPGSPKLHLSESRADGISFQQSLEWLRRTLSTPLQLVIERMYQNENGDNGDNEIKKSDSKLIQRSRSPSITKCDSSDTDIKQEIFASFSEVEIENDRIQREHLVSLGIVPAFELSPSPTPNRSRAPSPTI